MNDDIWLEEAANYNNSFYDEYNYEKSIYLQKMSVILPKEKEVIPEKKPLLRAIEI